MEWWKNYAVRYLLGNIIGAVIVNIYMNSYNLWGSIAEHNFTVSEKLIILGVLGFAYCYIASAPILVFHSLRNWFFDFIDTDCESISNVSKKLKQECHKNCPKWKKQCPYKNKMIKNIIAKPVRFSVGFIIIVIILVGFLFFVPQIINIDYTDFDFTYFKIVLVFMPILIFAGYIPLIVIWQNKENYYKFLKDLAKRRNEYTKNEKQGDFIDSYKHLREHGNAFWILVFEIILLPIFMCSKVDVLPLIVVLWVIPGSTLWAFASYLEYKFTMDEDRKETI